MTTTPEQIDEWRKIPAEHQRLEFKEARNQFDNKKLYRYCVAIANEDGGHLLLGIKDKMPREVVGTKACSNTVDMAKRLFSAIHFRVDIEEVNHPDGRVLVFHIPSRPRGTAYHYEGAYLMRSGNELAVMSEDHLRRIFAEGEPNFLSNTAVSGIDGAGIVRLLDTQSYFDLSNLPYPENRLGVLDRFERAGFIIKVNSHYDITNLGAVLFAKSLDEIPALSGKAVRVVIYEGTNKFNIRLDQTFHKGYATGFQALVDFINTQIPTNEVIEKAIRRTLKMFPEIAIRELVANALIHQDFNIKGASVLVEIYSDRIEISNPGLPVIERDRFIDEYRSRNEQLPKIMRRFGVCEELGSGIDKVIESAEIFQLPAPDFEVGEVRTTAVLYAHRDFDEMEKRDRIRACYQHCCLRYVMGEKMTNQSLRERFKLPENKSVIVSRVIRDTSAQDLIRLEDPAGTSRRYVKYVPFWA